MKEVNHEYKINIEPGILGLLGPSLYTNIYYVLAELVANAYDADAKNVYIIEKKDSIIVEDDGIGMSYNSGDIKKYLDVALETRTTKEDELTQSGKRKRMGRKGIGKLAALSVSENVLVMTKKNNEKSGFILTKHVGEDHKLVALDQKDIIFQKIENYHSGTSIVMTKPHYGLHKTVSAMKNNLLKIFPLVNKNFKIHIIKGSEEIVIESFETEIIKQLCGLIILGKEFSNLAKYFHNEHANKKDIKFLSNYNTITIPLQLTTKAGKEKKYDLEIKGWIGAYRSTKDRKNDPNDFPDNFISLLSNGKLGDYNIMDQVGRNKLQEVYVVGQLHVDLFEETELPDMALSNRQGYKTDDPRYESVIKYVRNNLLPEIVNIRTSWSKIEKDKKNKFKIERQEKDEEELKQKLDQFKSDASTKATEKIFKKFDKVPTGIKEIIAGEMNEFLPILGLKSRVDEQKKKILICHTQKDKSLADIIYKMLSFNKISDEDILYTSSDYEECRPPDGTNLLDYLRKFFVNSYSNKKIYVIYVTSEDMAKSWFAVTEVGAGWITRSNQKIFNIEGYKPQEPLDVKSEWQTSKKSGEDISMTTKESDKFVVKIINICKSVGYTPKTKKKNLDELKRYINLA
ncbi:MAG: ATP-binding protein [Patescibacteria group bacterium]|jgi:hypothetical protein